MTWSLELGIAVALTVVVWSAFTLVFPSDPLGAGETVFVLAVFYGMVKLLRWAWGRWSLRPKAGADRK
jgi:hypothetical protein